MHRSATYSPEPSIVVSTLGAMSVSWRGKNLQGLGHGKQAALLGYLVLQPGPHRREALAELLWSSGDERGGRLNLRQALFNLHKLLQTQAGDSFITADRHVVGLVPNLRIQADVDTLMQLAWPSDEAKGQVENLEAAVALYCGPFLSTLELSDCPEFMEWLTRKRELAHRRMLDVLLQLMEVLSAQGQVHAALSYALRYQALEPWGELGYLWGMRLHTTLLQREAALATYEACRRVLERDLGVPPSASLQGLAEQLRYSTSGGSPHAEKLFQSSIPFVFMGEPVQGSLTATKRLLEQRQITVMFCALQVVGLTDPEDVMARLTQPNAECEHAIKEQGGHIVPVNGGGILAYFGYPQALENSALYALRAATRIGALATPDLEVRVGVHCGLMLISADLKQPDTTGVISNVAIHMHVRARSGEVLVSQVLRDRSQNHFRFTSLGPLALEEDGLHTETFRLGEAYGVNYHLISTARLSPLIGREEVLAVLDSVWAQARTGKVQSLLLQGEAGIGKSRVVHHFADRVSSGDGKVYELRCFSETRHSALYPVIQAWHKMIGRERGDSSATLLKKLASLLDERVPQLTQRVLPWLAQMLSLPSDGLPPLPSLPPEHMSATLHSMLVELLNVIANQSPVLVVLEDAHWADASTLAFMALLCASPAQSALCVLMTARPDSQANQMKVRQLVLPSLSPHAMTRLIRAQRADLSAPQVAHVMVRADGIPLYAIELLALNKLNASSDISDLPLNLHDLMAVRLQTLGSERVLTHWMACVGREIDEAMLEQLTDMTHAEFQAHVDRLLSSDLFQRLSDGRLQFKHALLQEAAYQTMPRGQRRVKHRRIALLMESARSANSLWAGGDAFVPEWLARHWTAADEPAQAIPYWLEAGRLAMARYMFTQAASHYKQGLDMLNQGLGQDVPQREALEFALLVNLAHTDQVLDGYGNAQALALMNRAVALLDAGVGNTLDRFNALWGQWEAVASLTGHEEAMRIAQQMLALAEQDGRPALRQQGLCVMGITSFWLGQPQQAQALLQQCIAFEDPATDEPVRSFYGRHIPANTRGYLACVQWQLGDAQAAESLIDQAMAMACRPGLAFDQALACTLAVTLYRWQANTERVRTLAQLGLDHAQTCQSTALMAFHKINLGWAAAKVGDSRAVNDAQPMAQAVRRSLSGSATAFLLPYAEMLMFAGDHGQALTVLDEVQAFSAQKQDKHNLPELYQLRSICLQALGNAAEARRWDDLSQATANGQGRSGCGVPGNSVWQSLRHKGR